MPVIGRLDRQVEDVLINPVAGRVREEAAPELGETRPARADDDAPRGAAGRPEPEEAAAEGARAGAPEQEGPQEPPGEAAGRARPRELPVWLL